MVRKVLVGSKFREDVTGNWLLRYFVLLVLEMDRENRSWSAGKRLPNNWKGLSQIFPG